MSRVEGLTDKLVRAKEDLARQNVVLHRENDRLRNRLLEVTAERDRFEKRVKHSTRKLETALARLNLLAEDV